MDKDFVDCMKHFKATGTISNGCNPSFIVLIPKKHDPIGFSDYRSVSLIMLLQILDGCLVVNEIIRMANIEKHKLLLFKVDFEKAFDSVNWIFLCNTIRQIGFGKNGLTCNKGAFKGISLANGGANLSLLQYADDTLFFRDWSRINAKNLILILKCFENASGLKINMSKSNIYGVGVLADEVEVITSSLGCDHGSTPFMYLGLPVGKRMRFSDGWNVVVNRFRDRLSSWKSKSLSICKRFTFIRSGGLGVGSIFAKNLGLIGKWKWHFLIEKEALRRMVIKDLYGEDGGLFSDVMVNTRTDANLSTAVQNALQTLLPRIHKEIREEFRTGSGSSNAGGNPPPVTIHTWLERFNKQKPHSFEKATAPVDAENWISHMEKIFDVMGCEDAFKTRLVVYKFEGNALAWWKAYKQAKCGDELLKREYHSIHQTSTETSTEFMQRFLRLAGFLRAAAGTEEEQAKNFQWGLRRSTLNHLMCMSYMDVAQVANAARNYEILHERDDDDTERPDKR
nr:zinc finger, CCHC-type, retrotransposon Gag domain protein [Tanacetum cinerariifolium]